MARLGRRAFVAGGLAAACEAEPIAAPPASEQPQPSASAVVAPAAVASVGVNERGRVALCARYPELARLPWRALMPAPTPVEPALALGATLGVGELWLKRDDRSSPLVSGGKVRKLEWLLAEALARGHREVITFGGAGSNHALATACFCREVGLLATVALAPQPKGDAARRTLQRCAELGARIVFVAGVDDAYARALARTRNAAPETVPYVIAPGGTSPRGNLGFVEAAFELADQIRTGVLPAPNRIVLAMGTMGSAAGLAIGLGAAGLAIPITAVRCSSPAAANISRFTQLVRETTALIRTYSAHFVDRPAAVTFEERQLGKGYGIETPAGRRALSIARTIGNLTLEPTYTAKALAALPTLALSQQRVLFWLSQPAPIELQPMTAATLARIPAELRSQL